MGPVGFSIHCALVRDGVETSSNAVTKLDAGEDIEVIHVIRRADGMVRLGCMEGEGACWGAQSLKR
jgi:hypothetical protein